MDKNKIIIVLLAVSLIVNLATLSFVLTGGQFGTECRSLVVRRPQASRRPAPAPSRSLEAIAQRLGLTKEQRARFQAEDEKIRRAMEQNRDKLQEASGRLKAELQKESPDRDQVHAYLGQIDEYHQLAQIARVDLLLDLRAMLSADKKAKFDKMLESGPRPGGSLGPETGWPGDRQRERASQRGRSGPGRHRE